MSNTINTGGSNNRVRAILMSIGENDVDTTAQYLGPTIRTPPLSTIPAHPLFAGRFNNYATKMFQCIGRLRTSINNHFPLSLTNTPVFYCGICPDMFRNRVTGAYNSTSRFFNMDVNVIRRLHTAPNFPVNCRLVSLANSTDPRLSRTNDDRLILAGDSEVNMVTGVPIVGQTNATNLMFSAEAQRTLGRRFWCAYDTFLNGNPLITNKMYDSTQRISGLTSFRGRVYFSVEAEGKIYELSQPLNQGFRITREWNTRPTGPSVFTDFATPTQLVAISDNEILYTSYVAVYKLNLTTGAVTNFAGSYGPIINLLSGTRTEMRFMAPSGIVIDSFRNTYIGNQTDMRGIYQIPVSPLGAVVPIAGGDYSTSRDPPFFGGYYAGDVGPAILSYLTAPTGLAIDSFNNIYVSDPEGNRVAKVSSVNGIINRGPAIILTTIAGNNIRGYSGDGGAARSASINGPRGIAIDSFNNLYFCDTGNNRIRKITPINGEILPTSIITTVAGNECINYYERDGNLTKLTCLFSPQHIAIDSSGNIYVDDRVPYTTEPRSRILQIARYLDVI